MHLRHLLAAALGAALVSTGGAAVAAPAKKDGKKPARIDLPTGFQPEGIASGRGQDLFVGSIPTGAVLRVDARTGEFETVVEGAEGRAAIGLKADRQDRLFVAGGPTGKAFVHDADTGELLAEFQLAPDDTTFVNDVTLTKGTAYFTDSQRAVLYAVDRDLSGFREIELDGFELVEGFNLNGIAATPGGRYLLAVQSATGDLWRIDPDTGESVRVDTGGYELTNGDGLLRKGRRLYVVQNRLNTIAVLGLGKRFRTAELEKTITSSAFDVPTTVARKGKSLYAVNARFGTPSPETAEYWITRVRR